MNDKGEDFAFVGSSTGPIPESSEPEQRLTTLSLGLNNFEMTDKAVKGNGAPVKDHTRQKCANENRKCDLRSETDYCRFAISFRKHYLEYKDLMPIIVDVRYLDGPERDKELHGHRGGHPDMVAKMLENEDAKEIVMQIKDAWVY